VESGCSEVNQAPVPGGKHARGEGARGLSSTPEP
jgi:hypothetical protein